MSQAAYGCKNQTPFAESHALAHQIHSALLQGHKAALNLLMWPAQNWDVTKPTSRGIPEATNKGINLTRRGPSHLRHYGMSTFGLRGKQRRLSLVSKARAGLVEARFFLNSFEERIWLRNQSSPDHF